MSTPRTFPKVVRAVPFLIVLALLAAGLVAILAPGGPLHDWSHRSNNSVVPARLVPGQPYGPGIPRIWTSPARPSMPDIPAIVPQPYIPKIPRISITPIHIDIPGIRAPLSDSNLQGIPQRQGGGEP